MIRESKYWSQTFVILLSLLKSKNSCAGPTCPHFTPRLRLEVFGHLEKEEKKLALIKVPTYLKPCDCWDWVSLDLKEAENIFAFSWRELVWRFDELRLLSWRFQGCRILLPILKIRCEKPIFEDGKKTEQNKAINNSWKGSWQGKERIRKVKQENTTQASVLFNISKSWKNLRWIPNGQHTHSTLEFLASKKSRPNPHTSESQYLGGWN